MSINVETDGERIYLRSPWYPGVAQECKSVPGAKWVASEKVWSYPLTMAVCRSMRKVFGERLIIGPDLWAWAAQERSREERSIALSLAQDADLVQTPRLAPRLAEAMGQRVYQQAGARFLAETRTAGILDEPGLGKTAALLSAVMEAGLWRHGTRHLVIAPKTAVLSTWPDEIQKWTVATEVFAMDGPQQYRHDKLREALGPRSQGPTFVIINPNMLQVKVEQWCKKCKLWADSDFDKDMESVRRHLEEQHKTVPRIRQMDYPELFDIEWDSIIADECNRYLLKIRPGRKAGKMPQWAEGAIRLRVKEGGLKLTATGTPFRGKEYNIFGILHWMNPEKYRSFWQWVDTYLHKSNNGFGIKIGGLREEAADDFNRMMSQNFIRRTRKEVRAELPDQVIVDHWVNLEGKHAKQYKQFEAEGVAALDSGQIEGIGVLAELTRLRQFSWGCYDGNSNNVLMPVGPSPKYDMLLDMLDERGINKDSEGEPCEKKIIIASQFTKVVNWTAQQLQSAGIRTLMITGAVSGANRSAVVKDFTTNAEGPKVLLVNTTAGGESITLDAMCDEMIILDETFVEDDQIQLRGRIDNRGNRIATRFYHYIRTRNTIEESIAQSNIDQAELQATLLDRRRGVELAERLLKQ